MRAMLAVVKGCELKDELSAQVSHLQLKGDIGADDTRDADDVAKTQPDVFEKINRFMGVNQSHCFDICPWVPHFEKRKDYDAELDEYPPVLAFNNFPWGNAKLHMRRMVEKFIDDGQSFIIICNGKIDERVYFKSWIELFAKKVKLPIMAFGGYGERKNDHGVLIVYLLQPEWWDRIIHLKKERSGKATPCSTEWKSHKHILRERNEAIAAFHDQEVYIPIKAIATKVGVSDKTVTRWARTHRSKQPRKQIRGPRRAKVKTEDKD